MNTHLRRGLAATTLAAALGATMAAPALAATPPTDGGVTVVDEPDTSGLNNVWTFNILGLPPLGLVQSVLQAPGKLLHS